MTEAIEKLIAENRNKWVSLHNEGDYTLVVSLNDSEIIREHFESGGSEINHSVRVTDDRLAEVCSVLLAGLRSVRGDDAEKWPSCSARKCADEIMKRANEIATKGE